MKITVEESAAFDIYSILSVKSENCSEVSQKTSIKSQMRLLASEINNEIGYEKALETFKSDEYKALSTANTAIYYLIDESHKGMKIDFSTADKLNYSRFLFKKNLQDKFFGNKLEEIKIGYQGYDIKALELIEEINEADKLINNLK